MVFPKVFQVLVSSLLLGVAACRAPGPAVPTVAPTLPPTMIAAALPTGTSTLSAVGPTTEPMSTTMPVALGAQLSFTPATYTDVSAGFALDYPVAWTLDPSSQVGVRGGQALLLSPGTTLETLAAGGTRVSIVTYIWDPKNDLDAYVAQRKVAWDASGFAIAREEQWQLSDGRPVYGFVLNTPERPTFTRLTTVGQDYLQIGGAGDPALVEEIARTLRPIN